MITISIQRSGKRNITLPIPYASLHIANLIMTTRFVQTRMSKYQAPNIPVAEPAGNYIETHTNTGAKELSTTPLTRETRLYIRKQVLKPLIRELKKHRGLTLVDATEKGEQRIVMKL